MRHPAFQSLPRLLLYAGICLLVGLAIIVSQSGLVPVAHWILILDGLVSGLIFGILSILLWYVIRFAGLTGSDSLQKIVNYSALVLLLNIVWIGTDSLFLYFSISRDNFTAMAKSIPMKAVMGLLIYTLVMRLLINMSSDDELSDDEQDDTKKPDPHKPGVVEVYANPASSTTRWPEKITVKVGQKIHVIAITDIIFLQAEGDYVKIVTTSSHFIKEQTMKSFEENLPPSKFVRIHRSVIVNVDVISRIELYEKQYYRITLQSGHQLKASATGYRLLKNTLQL